MGRSGCSALQRRSAHNAEAHDVKRRTSYFVLQGASLFERMSCVPSYTLMRARASPRIWKERGKEKEMKGMQRDVEGHSGHVGDSPPWPFIQST